MKQYLKDLRLFPPTQINFNLDSTYSSFFPNS